MGALGKPIDGPGQPDTLAAVGITLPLVTVVVTVFNYERYILQCLASIAAQDYARFHCVIVDDVSTDRSVELVQSFIASHGLAERFQLVRHERNGGQLEAFRTGLARTAGEFVAFVDADDMWQPDFLSRHIAAHLSHEPVAFTSSDQYQINERDELIAGLLTDHQARGNVLLVNSFHIYANWWVWGTTSTMVFRRAMLDVIMPPDTELFRRCADNYLCHFANLLGSSLLIPQQLGYYRRHGNNLFSGNRIVGGDTQPPGNMASHPPHELLRSTVRTTLQDNLPQFHGLLGGVMLARSLAFTMTLPETLSLIIRLSWGKTWNDASANFMMSLLALNFVYRFRWRVRRWMMLKPRPRMVIKNSRSIDLFQLTTPAS